MQEGEVRMDLGWLAEEVALLSTSSKCCRTWCSGNHCLRRIVLVCGLPYRTVYDLMRFYGIGGLVHGQYLFYIEGDTG